MFDRVEIKVKAGDGGDGIVSFRHEKFVPFGGADGGDGGNGGNVIIKASGSVDSLLFYKRRRFFRAEDGEDGKSKKRHGKKGEDLVLEVPVGTVVMEKNEFGQSGLIADLTKDGDEVVVAKGGKGGLGNPHFASSTNQTPRIALKGEVGEEKEIILEMRLIADVGIIGYPNAGKSTLLAQASKARPKIAGYPFTTLEPVLGVTEVDGERMVLAEIPGLVDGAHLGRGLGHDFLRHIMRTKVLIHLIDGSLPHPLEAMTRVNSELYFFDSALIKKPQVVALNKIDLPQVKCRLDKVKEEFLKAGIRLFPIAASTGEGVVELLKETLRRLKELEGGEEKKELVRKVFHPQTKDTPFSVEREGDVFIIKAKVPRLLFPKGEVEEEELKWQLERQLKILGLFKMVERAGVKPGDRVRWGEFEWKWG